MSSVRVSVHHLHQLELKLVHSLEPPQPERTVEAWFYFPHSLGIDEPAFRKEQFYEDLTAYVRFQTPRMSLEQLFADGVRSAPFAWLAQHEDHLTSGNATDADFSFALRELRLGAAVFRAAVRDHRRFVAHELRGHTPPPAVVERHAEQSRRFLVTCRDALDRYRVLRLHYEEARTPPTLLAALDAIDDFLSVQALEGWFGLLEIFQVRNGSAVAVTEALRQAIRAETTYRESAGLVPQPSADARVNERFVSRVNLLKKWVLAVLHLRVRSSRRTEHIQDLLFGIAAAVAMTFAVALQLVALWTVGTPTSPQVGGTTLFAFVGLAVGGYILKDRLKDRLKIWFQAGIPYWLYDRRQDLSVEASGLRLGSIEETVRLVRPNEVGPFVARLREAGEDPLFAEQRAEEDVIHYRRKMCLDSERARKSASEMTGIDEILRLNVARWVRRMDDPARELSRLEGDTIGTVSARKTYKVTLIVARGEEQRRYERFAIVLTRDGIERIEEIGGI